jgi:hypothetical protein
MQPAQPFDCHWAMHGTAINPDTDTTAEYKELSTCTEGPAWQASNADEIGRMFQGLGVKSYMPSGTETLWFIHPSQIPKGKKPTYVRVVCAACDGLQEATASIILATRLLRRLT